MPCILGVGTIHHMALQSHLKTHAFCPSGPTVLPAPLCCPHCGLSVHISIASPTSTRLAPPARLGTCACCLHWPHALPLFAAAACNAPPLAAPCLHLQTSLAARPSTQPMVPRQRQHQRHQHQRALASVPLAHHLVHLVSQAHIAGRVPLLAPLCQACGQRRWECQGKGGVLAGRRGVVVGMHAWRVWRWVASQPASPSARQVPAGEPAAAHPVHRVCQGGPLQQQAHDQHARAHGAPPQHVRAPPVAD
jgi:hypothetical protein